MEQINLTNPITFYKVGRLLLDWDQAAIEVSVSFNGVTRNFQYNGTIATNLMVALNKANLSVQSLHNRILSRLISDGLLSGTISGTPD